MLKQLAASPHLPEVPALYKIFDEILVNAADNSKRDTKVQWKWDRDQNCTIVNTWGDNLVSHNQSFFVYEAFIENIFNY